jgi:hypothetical protein
MGSMSTCAGERADSAMTDIQTNKSGFCFMYGAHFYDILAFEFDSVLEEECSRQ